MRLVELRMMGHAGWPTPPAVALLLASLKQLGHSWWTKTAHTSVKRESRGQSEVKGAHGHRAIQNGNTARYRPSVLRSRNEPGTKLKEANHLDRRRRVLDDQQTN